MQRRGRLDGGFGAGAKGELLRRPQSECVDQPAVSHVACDGPSQLHDLFLGVVEEEFVEQVLVDVGVVNEDALGVMESGLFGVRKALVAPGADPGDSFLFEGVSFP